jgi:hypothetical protein
MQTPPTMDELKQIVENTHIVRTPMTRVLKEKELRHNKGCYMLTAQIPAMNLQAGNKTVLYEILAICPKCGNQIYGTFDKETTEVMPCSTESCGTKFQLYNRVLHIVADAS